MTKLKKILSNSIVKSIGLILAFLVISILVNLYFQKQIKYIDTTKIFDEFEMTKEMQKQLQSVGISRKNYLDSLHITIESLDRQIKNGNTLLEKEYNQRAVEYLELKKGYEEDQSTIAKQFDAQVIDKFNKLVKQYGEEKGIDFLFGVSGNGNIMHAKSDDDITEDVLKYINSKYKTNGK